MLHPYSLQFILEPLQIGLVMPERYTFDWIRRHMQPDNQGRDRLLDYISKVR